LSLSELNSQLRELATTSYVEQSRQRTSRRVAVHEAARNDFQVRIDREENQRPMSPLTLMGSLAKVLPPDVAVIEEAVTTTNTTFERLGVLKNTTGYFGHRGWALGWGLGVSIGAKLAWPNRPVLSLLGEGAALYGIQGLWTAARYQIPVTFVICNNAQYQILKIGAKGLNLPRANQGRFEGLDIRSPEIDFLALARAFGVESHRVSDADELAERVRDSLQNNRLALFDVPIRREVQSRLNYG
jgi:benzoylformate decarboxylase